MGESPTLFPTLSPTKSTSTAIPSNARTAVPTDTPTASNSDGSVVETTALIKTTSFVLNQTDDSDALRIALLVLSGSCLALLIVLMLIWLYRKHKSKKQSIISSMQDDI